MYCRQCGAEVPVDAEFCSTCGAETGRGKGGASGELVHRVGGLSFRRVLGGFCFVGAVLAFVGIFSAWAEVGGWVSAGISGWDLVSNGTVLGEKVGRETYACLAFAGALIALIGALAVLVFSSNKLFWGALVLGSALAVAGSAWGFSDIDTGGFLGIISVDRGAGLYLTLAGGVIGLTGSLGLRG